MQIFFKQCLHDGQCRLAVLSDNEDDDGDDGHHKDGDDTQDKDEPQDSDGDDDEDNGSDTLFPEPLKVCLLSYLAVKRGQFFF